MGQIGRIKTSSGFPDGRQSKLHQRRADDGEYGLETWECQKWSNQGCGSSGEFAWQSLAQTSNRYVQVVQEKPDELAEAMWRYLGMVMGELTDPSNGLKAKLW